MKTDSQWMAKARHQARFSDDPDTRVGCVIVDSGDMLVSAGANHMPYGIAVVPSRLVRPEKYKWIEHAERNAIYEAARQGKSTRGCDMYLPWFPCVECARAIVQAGIRELVCFEPDVGDPRWGEDFKRAIVVLAEGRVDVRYVARDT